MRPCLCTLLGLMVAIGLSDPGHATTDLSTMHPTEIEALQKRLTDDGCYSGAIDGQASPATTEAVNACPDQQPVLRIETGTHVAPITAIDNDAACRLLATSSDDKTVRLWSLPDALLLKTIRLPIGEGDSGKAYAVALSPDGRLLATGGNDPGWDKDKGMGLYVVDVGSNLVRRFGAFESSINALAFSADGQRVAIGLGQGKGIRVLAAADGQELLADKDYGNEVDGLTFGPDGSLFVASEDGFLRRYGASLRLDVKVRAPAGRNAYDIAVDPSGRRVAVGYDHPPNVSILDATSLRLLARADTRGLTEDGDLSSVAWTSDGQQLVAGGLAETEFGEGWRNILRRFAPNGKHLGRDVAVSSNTIHDLKRCGSGIAFGSTAPEFGLVSADGLSRTLQSPVIANLRKKLGQAFTASPAGDSIRFGLGLGASDLVEFDLAAGTLSGAPTTQATSFTPPQVEGLRVTDWEDQDNPKFVDGP